MNSLVASLTFPQMERTIWLLYVVFLSTWVKDHAHITFIPVDSEFQLVYGTSCSTLISGAIFTMVNDARIAADKLTIGFINPTVREIMCQRTLHVVTRLFSVDLIRSVCWCFQRYHYGKQPRMWNQRIQRHSRLGPCDLSRNAQLAQLAASLDRPSLRNKNVNIERAPASPIPYSVLFLILCVWLEMNVFSWKARDSTFASRYM